MVNHLWASMVWQRFPWKNLWQYCFTLCCVFFLLLTRAWWRSAPRLRRWMDCRTEGVGWLLLIMSVRRSCFSQGSPWGMGKLRVLNKRPHSSFFFFFFYNYQWQTTPRSLLLCLLHTPCPPLNRAWRQPHSSRRRPEEAQLLSRRNSLEFRYLLLTKTGPSGCRETKTLL